LPDKGLLAAGKGLEALPVDGDAVVVDEQKSFFEVRVSDQIGDLYLAGSGRREQQADRN
jgi:hypothetical protein